MPAGGRRGGRGGLSADTSATIKLDAWVGRLAIAVSRGEAGYPGAVADLALTVPARPDLVDEVAEKTGRADLGLNWPPVDIMRDLLARTRRVTTGEVPMLGPGGVRVVHASTSREDGSRRCRLRVCIGGVLVAEVLDPQQLARHVDPGRLVAVDPVDEVDPVDVAASRHPSLWDALGRGWG